jgi:hypothetical protein
MIRLLLIQPQEKFGIATVFRNPSIQKPLASDASEISDVAQVVAPKHVSSNDIFAGVMPFNVSLATNARKTIES